MTAGWPKVHEVRYTELGESDSPNSIHFRHCQRMSVRQTSVFVFICLAVLYVLFVDIFNVLGPKPNTPISTSTSTVPSTTTQTTATAVVVANSTSSANTTSHINTDWITPLQYSNVPREGICQNVSFFVMVRCRADDLDFREKWRKTFGSFAKDYNFAYAFLIALPSNSSVQVKIGDEIAKYHDIFQCNHIDAYMNVTYKTLSALKYFSETCDNSTVLMKVDDDTFFDVTVFDKLIPKFKAMKEGFLCSPIINNKPVRNPKGVWYVTKEQYEEDYFPDYCDGSFFLTKHEIATKVVALLKPDVKYFWVDDVFVSGLMREKIGTGIVAIRNILDIPYVQLSQHNAFAYFARAYPYKMCNGTQSEASNCIAGISAELERNRKPGPKRRR